MKIAKLFMTLLLLFLAFAAGARQEALLNRLQADHEALIAAQRDYQRQREQGTLGAAETADYADYLVRLRERVSQDCLMLAQAHIRLPDEVQCPASLPGVAKPAPIDQRSEQTSAERTATMDAKLNAGLGEFDEMLLREQEQVKAAAARSERGGAGAGSGQGSSGQGSSGQGGAQGEGDSGAEAAEAAEGALTGDAGESGDVTGSGGRPPSGAAGGGGTRTGARGRPADIPDGSDDDLVARQMREAAEKETNPGLKKKLWEEYRKYKQGAR
jgi:hypothetical protein